MTPVSLWRGGLRIMLDDFNPTARRYPDQILDCGVVNIVQMGLINKTVLSPPTGFSITPDGQNITPDVVTNNPKGPDLFALVSLLTVRQFMNPKPSEFSFATRPLKVKTGNFFRYLDFLDAEIHALSNGPAMFNGYQSYYSWMEGMAGLPLGEVLAQFNIQSPLWAATFTRDGMRVA